MKKYFFMALTMMVLGVCSNADAQERKASVSKVAPKVQRQRPTPEKMMEMRVKIMSNRLMLSDGDAAKFEKLYKNYLEDMQKVYKEGKADKKVDAKKPERKVLTDADIDARFKQNFEKRAKMVSLQKNYYEKFRKMLSAKQVSKIFEPSMAPRFHKRPGKPVPFHGKFQKGKDAKQKMVHRFPHSPKRKITARPQASNGKTAAKK